MWRIYFQVERLDWCGCQPKLGPRGKMSQHGSVTATWALSQNKQVSHGTKTYEAFLTTFMCEVSVCAHVQYIEDGLYQNCHTFSKGSAHPKRNGDSFQIWWAWGALEIKWAVISVTWKPAWTFLTFVEKSRLRHGISASHRHLKLFWTLSLLLYFLLNFEFMSAKW
jgi:hypothetical protein